MIDREALEDAVYEIYEDTGVGMDELQMMPLEKLKWMLERAQGKWTIPPVPSSDPKNRAPRAPRERKPIPQKLLAEYQVRNGNLYWVEQWKHPLSDGTWKDVEYSKQCYDRVTFEGRRLSVPIVIHYLTTGEWVKRVPSATTKPHKAVVWHEGKAKHLGYFATAEERDAAVFAWKLGLHKNS